MSVGDPQGSVNECLEDSRRYHARSSWLRIADGLRCGLGWDRIAYGVGIGDVRRCGLRACRLCGIEAPRVRVP